MTTLPLSLDAGAVALRDALDERRFGGKAAALAVALRAGLPVPDGVALGLVDGALVESGPTATAVAGRVAGRLLAAGGELLTVVLGADAPDGLAADLQRHVGVAFPAVEVQVLPGGQPGVVALGAE